MRIFFFGNTPEISGEISKTTHTHTSTQPQQNKKQPTTKKKKTKNKNNKIIRNYFLSDGVGWPNFLNPFFSKSLRNELYALFPNLTSLNEDSFPRFTL